MPATTLKCPDCGAMLRLSNPIPTGTRIKCPKCNTIFPAPRAATAPSAAVRPAPPVEAPPKYHRDINEDDALADDSAGLRLPRKAVRKPGPADDYDDADEFDDDDDTTRPRRPARSRKKKAGNGVLIGVLAGLVVLLLGLGAVGAWVWPGFLRGNTIPKGTGTEDLLAYLPANCSVFVGVDVPAAKEMLGTELVEKLKAQAAQSGGPNMPRGILPPFLDAERVAVGASILPSPQVTVVLKTSQPYDADEMARALKVKTTPQKVAGRIYYKEASFPAVGLGGAGGMPGGGPQPGFGGGAGGRPGFPRPGMPGGPAPGGGRMVGGPIGGAVGGTMGVYVCMPNDRIVFFHVGSQQAMEECLKSDGSTVKLSAEALRLARYHEAATFWFGFLLDEQMRTLMQLGAAQNPMLNNPLFRKEFDKSMEFLKQTKWGGMAVTGTAKVKVKFALACNSPAIAAQVTQTGKAQWNKMGKGMVSLFSGMVRMKPGGPEIAKAIEELAGSLSYLTEGDISVTTCELNRTTLEAAIAGARKMMGP